MKSVCVVNEISLYCAVSILLFFFRNKFKENKGKIFELDQNEECKNSTLNSKLLKHCTHGEGPGNKHRTMDFYKNSYVYKSSLKSRKVYEILSVPQLLVPYCISYHLNPYTLNLKSVFFSNTMLHLSTEMTRVTVFNKSSLHRLSPYPYNARKICKSNNTRTSEIDDTLRLRKKYSSF